MNQHRYSTRARELSCVIPRVKSSGITWYATGITYHLKYDRVFFCIFYHMIIISIMGRVIFSEYYFKDHIGNKCTLVCFNVSSLVRLHAC